MFIEHGKTLQERKGYADRIWEYSTDYYYYLPAAPSPARRNVQWNRINKIPLTGLTDILVGNRSAAVVQTDRILVEVWDKRNSDIWIHPSRNRFHWIINDQGQKEVWHELARLKSADLRVQIPNMAKKVEDLIGYTWADPIVFNRTPGAPNFQDQLLGFKAQASVPDRCDFLPSVYYKSGHLTLDHKDPTNIGWKDFSPCQCLFFGNVPTKYAEK